MNRAIEDLDLHELTASPHPWRSCQLILIVIQYGHLKFVHVVIVVINKLYDYLPGELVQPNADDGRMEAVSAKEEPWIVRLFGLWMGIIASYKPLRTEGIFHAPVRTRCFQ